MKSLSVPQSNVGATLAVALRAVAQNPNITAEGANTHAQGAAIHAHGVTIHAQGDREGRPYGWALGLVLCFLLVLGCSNPYERDNPTDPAVVHRITFNANGATGGKAPAALTGSYGDVVTLPGQDSLVKTGYALGGWTDPDGKNYSASSSYTIKGGADMNANWLPVYTVTFDGNGIAANDEYKLPGTIMSPGTITVVSGSSIQIPAGSYNNSIERTGYVFGGWNTNSSGTGTNYAVGSFYYPTGNITLYANWTQGYTLTFDGNGATSGTAPAVRTIALGGSSITIPNDAGSLQKTGYGFDGWYSNNSGTGTKYDIGSSYTFTGNITLYANWVQCSSNEGNGTFTDARDGKTYGYVTICTQTWMSQNLNYDASGKCYDNLDSNCDKYGRLYDRSTAMTVCPEGWHLPTKEEWQALGINVGGAGKLKVTTGWISNGNGTDDYGFSALPGGGGNYANSPFSGAGFYGYWCTSSVIDGNYYYMSISNSDNYLRTQTQHTSYQSTLHSVRCLKDN